jgi:hypothetical protein
MPPSDHDDWTLLLARPRYPNATVAASAIPTTPGVYAWFQDGACVYVGKATNLRSRLGKHRSGSLDLSRSTLRASVAVAELGVTRQHARSRPTVMTREQTAVVSAGFERAELTWIESATPADAAALEDRLRAAWRPPLNRM